VIRLLAVPLLSLVMLVADDGVVWEKKMQNDGIDITAVVPGRVNSPVPYWGANSSVPLSTVVFTPAPQPEYLRVIACPGNSTTHPGQDPCLTATTPCRDKPGTGVLTRIYTRPPGNPTTPWQHLTDTCDPDPLTNPTPTGPTLTDIQHAFATTPFATPTTTTQPPDGHTLTTLPIYLTTTWTGPGYTPGQTRTLTLLGQHIDLAIKLDHYTYTFGDGTSTGPTTSPGGPYPTGDITHPYRRPGTYTPTTTATLTADYRLNNGPWQPINGTATRTTTGPTITVHTATNRLHPNPA